MFQVTCSVEEQDGELVLALPRVVVNRLEIEEGQKFEVFTLSSRQIILRPLEAENTVPA